MIHLRSYHIFEAQSTEHWEVHDILLDLFEEYGYKVPEFVQKYSNQHDIQAGSDRWGRIEVSDYRVFGAKCLRIRITDSNGRLFKSGTFKDFNGFYEVGTEKYKQLLQEAHQRIIQFINPVEVIVGSIGHYTRDLDLLYFHDKPNFNRFGDVEIYGSNIGIELDKLKGSLQSNSRHQNIFDLHFTQGHSVRMFCVMGYYDGYFYNQNLLKMGDGNTKPEKWIQSEWDNICKKLKIKDMQKVNMDNPKITVAEFMTHLRNNQDNYLKLNP